MGRSAAPKSARGAAPVEPRLLEQAQMLAFTSVREDVPVEEVTRDLERLSHEAQAADQPALAAAVLKAQDALGKAQRSDRPRQRARRAVRGAGRLRRDRRPSRPALAPVSAPVPLAPIAPITLVEDFEHDDEMREIFLEEAREVVDDARAPRAPSCSATPGDIELLTTLRRAFHTLKGSSRMVGLKAFGEAAWSCEQVFNTQLAEQRAAEPPLLEFADWVLGYLGDWVEDIAAHRSAASTTSATVQAAAAQARRHRRRRRAAVGHRAADRLARRPAEPRRPRPAEAADRSCRAAGAAGRRSAEARARPARSSSTCPASTGSSSPAAPRAAAGRSRRRSADALGDVRSASTTRRSEAMQTTLTNERVRAVAVGGRSTSISAARPTRRRMIQSLAPSEDAARRATTSPG